MKISKNSWHYRFNDYNNDNFSYRFSKGTYTTCSYIRTTLASFIGALFKCLIMLCVLGLFLFVGGSMILVPVVVFMGIIPYELPAVMCVTGWVFAIIGLTVLFVHQVRDWVDNREVKVTERPKKEPNVFVQAIIDKHNKFCTLVTAE